MFAREFAAIHGISIDYAVMEHARDVVVIEAPFAWDDVGSWQAIARLQGADADGNTISGQAPGLATPRGTIVRGGGRPPDRDAGRHRTCIVVHTPDATLVANKHDEESIRRAGQADCRARVAGVPLSMTCAWIDADSRKHVSIGCQPGAVATLAGQG